MKFRKLPIVIDALQFDGTDDNYKMIQLWSGGRAYIRGTKLEPKDREMEIQTLEGYMRARCGDWIIRGPKGEYYPCKPDIFEMTYEPVKEEG